MDGGDRMQTMCDVGAAPHLFDDALIASPELALVDGDLAEQLRAAIVPGDAFRPRPIARPDHELRYDNVVELPRSPELLSVDETEVAAEDTDPVEETPADVVDDTVE